MRFLQIACNGHVLAFSSAYTVNVSLPVTDIRTLCNQVNCAYHVIIEYLMIIILIPIMAIHGY